MGIVSYTASGRDHFTRVFTYLDWINGILSSPPQQSQMPRPRCFNSCCDDPDWLDSYADECHTWTGYDCVAYSQSNVGLLEKCRASCKRCPSCKATNRQCCDNVDFLDASGMPCSSWRGYNSQMWAGPVQRKRRPSKTIVQTPAGSVLQEQTAAMRRTGKINMVLPAFTGVAMIARKQLKSSATLHTCRLRF